MKSILLLLLLCNTCLFACSSSCPTSAEVKLATATTTATDTATATATAATETRNYFKDHNDDGEDEYPFLPSSTLPLPPSSQKKKQHQNQKEAPKTHKLNSLVTLDLAGMFDIHLISSSRSSSSNDYDGETMYYNNSNKIRPIFQWGQKKITTMNSNNICSSNIQNIPKPNVYIGGEYNFKNVWYGLTKAITTLSWGNIDARQYNHCHLYHTFNTFHNIQEQQQQQQQQERATVSAAATPAHLLSSTISAEKGLLSSNDYAVNCGIALPNIMHLIKNNPKTQKKTDKIGKSKAVYTSPSSAVVRYETMNPNHDHCPTASIIVRSGTFLHPRIEFVGKSTTILHPTIGTSTTTTQKTALSPSSSRSSSTKKSFSFLSRIQQRKFDLSDESSWVPDIKITPSGKVISDCSLGFSPLLPRSRGAILSNRSSSSTSTSSGSSSCNRIGVRLMIKKQMNWNIFGSLFQQDGNYSGGSGVSNGNGMMTVIDDFDEVDNDTNVRLEVCGLSGTNSCTSIAIDVALERMKESFRCTIAQEGVIK